MLLAVQEGRLWLHLARREGLQERKVRKLSCWLASASISQRSALNSLNVFPGEPEVFHHLGCREPEVQTFNRGWNFNAGLAVVSAQTTASPDIRVDPSASQRTPKSIVGFRV